MIGLLSNWKVAVIGLSVASLGITGAYWLGKRDGRKDERAKIAIETLLTNDESRKGANNVRIKEQRLTDGELDGALCGAGIVRGRIGCGN